MTEQSNAPAGVEVKFDFHKTQAWKSRADIPNELQQMHRFTGVLKTGEATQRVWFYEIHEATRGVRLQCVLVDACQRVEGIVVGEEWVYHPSVFASGAYTLFFVPLASENQRGSAAGSPVT